MALAASLLDQLDDRPATLQEAAMALPGYKPVPPVPRGALDPKTSPVLAELDAIVVMQLLYPFDGPKDLGARCKRSAKYIAQVIGTAAYQTLYEKRRKEFNLAVGLPSLAEKIDGAARLALERLMERIESSDDGNFLRLAFDSLMKAKGEGGHAPQAATNVFIDARQAEIMGVRSEAMQRAKDAGPYPPTARQGDSPYEPMPVLEPAGLLAGVQATPPITDVVESPVIESSPVVEGDPLASLEAELQALPGAQP